MINVDFDNYIYFPTLRTRQAELRGLKELDKQRKKQILPLLTLGRWPKASNFEVAAEKAKEAMINLPYLIDLTSDASHLGDQQKKLRNPENYFSAWRAFVTTYENAIPVIQFVPDAKSRDEVKQAQSFENEIGKLAFRIKDFSSDTIKVIKALSAIDDLKNAVVFIDCGYIRETFSAYLTASINTINTLRSEFPELMIVILSTSFPASTIQFADSTKKRGSIGILERDFHERIGGDNVAAYGDHSSIHSVVYDEFSKALWVPRIDFPSERIWYFERRPRDTFKDQDTEVAYISAAKAILESNTDLGNKDIWGEQQIIDAANGKPYAKAPASWIAVRVNIHLARQLDFSLAQKQMNNSDEPDDDYEW